MRSKSLSTVLFAVLSLSVSAQSPTTTQTVGEPEYAGVAFLLSTSGLSPLERQLVHVQTKLKVAGLGGGIRVASFHGAASPVRVNGDGPEFVVRLEGNLDPSLLVIMNSIASRGDARESVLAAGGVMGLKEKTVENTMLQPTFTKYGEHSVKFTIVALPETHRS